MSQFFDFDPVSGLRYDFDYDEATGQAKIITSQDISGFIDRNKAAQNIGATDHGIKSGYWHYASIPVTVQVELRQKGLDIFSKDPAIQKRIFREINQNYPWCKLTTKHHE